TIRAELGQTDGKYVLNITNETGRNIEHLSLIFNNQLYYIGDIAADSQIEQNLPGGSSLDSLIGVNPNLNYYGNSYSHMLSSMAGVDLDELQREKALLAYGIELNH